MQINNENKYDFWSGINTKTWEDGGVFFEEKDLYGVFQPHLDPFVISTFSSRWRAERIVVNEGSVAIVIYANCWKKMGVNSDHILTIKAQSLALNGIGLPAWLYCVTKLYG